MKPYILATVGLGLYFRGVQALEYYVCPFSLIDGAYGAIFFMSTGAHGLHVFVEALALLVATIRLRGGAMSRARHFGFEAAAWYWHFVDVVWLVLFSLYY